MGKYMDEYMGQYSVEFSVLTGKVIKGIVVNDNTGDYDSIEITCTDGSKYLMAHQPDCCELVFIEEIIGDLMDIVGAPILLAEKVSQELNNPDDEYGSWTFYKIVTNMGKVTFRWLGTSNGWYSTDVDFFELKAAD